MSRGGCIAIFTMNLHRRPALFHFLNVGLKTVLSYRAVYISALGWKQKCCLLELHSDIHAIIWPNWYFLFHHCAQCSGFLRCTITHGERDGCSAALQRRAGARDRGREGGRGKGRTQCLEPVFPSKYPLFAALQVMNTKQKVPRERRTQSRQAAAAVYWKHDWFKQMFSFYVEPELRK